MGSTATGGPASAVIGAASSVAARPTDSLVAPLVVPSLRAGFASRFPGSTLRRSSVLWPTLFAALNALAFFLVQPNVGDLQAALARESAADNGVGLTGWFQWFGGGSTPGNYSVVVPYLSSLIGAPLLGVLATVAITPLAAKAVRSTAFPVAAMWTATFAAACNIWSGRIPFALGCAVGLVGLLGVLERRLWLAAVGIVASTLCSPVSGAFLAFVLGAAFLVEREYRRLIFWVCAVCGATLLGIAIYFGNPGSQGYSIWAALLAAATAVIMLAARPAPAVRVMLVCTAIAAPLLTLFPNGMGSNFSRLPWICLPVVVVATIGTNRRLQAALAVLPALALCLNATVVDLVKSGQPSASAAYYDSLITQLEQVPDLTDYRLEVVQDPHIHTAAYALLQQAALAGGYETQEQHKLNYILDDAKRLNATSYKVWLDNNAVGYVALNKLADSDDPEYRLVVAASLPYLTPVSTTPKWTLYRVSSATPIVGPPQVLLSASQAKLRIKVTCACTFGVRVRYSKFLTARPERGGLAADVRDDGLGWSMVTTYSPGVYVFDGDFTRPLR